MTEINPLQRGILRDLLLAALDKSGIGEPNLAFLMGVDPETISATLARVSQKGSLQIIPGADYLNQVLTEVTVYPFQVYNLENQNDSPQFEIPYPGLYSLTMGMSGAVNGHEQIQLYLRVTKKGTNVPYIIGATCLTNQAVTQILYLPESFIGGVLSEGAPGDTASVEVILKQLPIGAL